MTENPMFANRVVMLAGATGNLGAAVAETFLARGANLVLVDRSRARTEEAFPGLSGTGEHLILECADMSEPESFRPCVEAALAHFGRIDVFVTVVGGFRTGTPLHETPIETFDFMMKLNARTLFVGAQAVIPAMISSGSGKIIAVGARPAAEGKKNMAAYSASKSAAVRLVESMAAELKVYGINVNAVIPGTMDTPQNREASPGADYGRWVKVESVAEVIAFLASDAASDIHGASVPVFGQT